MPITIPLVIRALNERLRFRYNSPQRAARLDTFTVDLSDWKLSLTDKTPCFWIHTPEQFEQGAIDLAEEIRDAVRQKAWQNVTNLVLVDGPADELRDQLKSSFTQFVVLDDKQQKEIFNAPSPTRTMLDILLNQMSRSQLSPYETSRPVSGSRFFGRKSYIKKIQTRSDTNFFVIGIRRIGKSSLLREIERLLDQSDPPTEGRRRHLYLDCSVLSTPDEFYREIISRLSPDALKMFLDRRSQSLRDQSKMFDYLAAEQRGRITFLLDEIDRLLGGVGNGQELFQVLRRASNEARARFIVAGFRDARQAVNNERHPFYNFGESLLLDALDRDEVEQMIKEPLDQLRVRLEGRDEIVSRVCHETAGLPNLVQFYCQILLEQLDRRSGNAITADDLRQVYDNVSFRDFVLSNFMSNALPLEQAVVFAILGAKETELRTMFTLRDVDAQLSRRRLFLRPNQLDEVCRNRQTVPLPTAALCPNAGRALPAGLHVRQRAL
jgi:hypothetical protein